MTPKKRIIFSTSRMPDFKKDDKKTKPLNFDIILGSKKDIELYKKHKIIK